MQSAELLSTAAPYVAAVLVGGVVVSRPQWLRRALWVRGIGAAAGAVFLFYAVTSPELRGVSLLWLSFAGLALFRRIAPDPPRSAPRP